MKSKRRKKKKFIYQNIIVDTIMKTFRLNRNLMKENYKK